MTLQYNFQLVASTLNIFFLSLFVKLWPFRGRIHYMKLPDYKIVHGCPTVNFVIWVCIKVVDWTNNNPRFSPIPLLIIQAELWVGEESLNTVLSTFWLESGNACAWGLRAEMSQSQSWWTAGMESGPKWSYGHIWAQPQHSAVNLVEDPQRRWRWDLVSAKEKF